jgi:hypothetical protein
MIDGQGGINSEAIRDLLGGGQEGAQRMEDIEKMINEFRDAAGSDDFRARFRTGGRRGGNDDAGEKKGGDRNPGRGGVRTLQLRRDAGNRRGDGEASRTGERAGGRRQRTTWRERQKAEAAKKKKDDDDKK